MIFVGWGFSLAAYGQIAGMPAEVIGQACVQRYAPLRFFADEALTEEDAQAGGRGGGQGRGAGPRDCAAAALSGLQKVVQAAYGGRQCARWG